ncbi:hypothetical protein [Nocardia sp. NPDC055049]
MTATTDTPRAEYEPGTRDTAVLLIKAAAVAVADLDKEATSDADAAAGLVAIDHVVRMAGVHAALAIEARLGEIAELLRPRSVDLGSAGIVYNPHGLTPEDIAEVYDRAAAMATARQTGGR